MTTRPYDHEHLWPVGALVALVLVAVMVMAAGCIQEKSPEPPAGSHTITSPTFTLSVTQFSVTSSGSSLDAKIQKTNETPHYLKPGTDLVPYNVVNYPSNGSNDVYTAYEANLTYPYTQLRQKGLLLYLDPNYPGYEMHREIYVREGTIVPADQAAARFNLTSTNDKPVGDQLLLVIDMEPGISTHIVDPYMTLVDYRSPENITCVRPDGKCVEPLGNGISGWVDTNNVVSLATLSGVKNIHLEKKLTGGHSGEGVPTVSGTVPPQTILTGTPAIAP